MTNNYTKIKTRKLSAFMGCLLLFLLLGLSSIKVNAQVTGTKTIPTDYASIQAAVTALNTSGASGNVIINVPAGYTETASATAIQLGSTTLNANLASGATITIQKNPSTSGANPLITAGTGGTYVWTTAGVTPNGIFALVGADNVTIDGIDLSENGSNTTTALMEYGYGMFKASVTDGCNNNTIKNCSIKLSRLNTTIGTAPASTGSTGIIVSSALITAPTVAITPTATSGSNSGNKFYTNTINQTNTGIALFGYAYATLTGVLYDNGNDIGGTATATGNRILNFGNSTTSTIYGIRTTNQYNINIEYNGINNNDGGGVNNASTGGYYGILNGAALSAPVTIKFDTIRATDAGTTTLLVGIENDGGSTAASNTVNMSNNQIIGINRTSATTGGTNAIWNTASCATLTMNNNYISGNTLLNTGSAIWYGLYNTGNVTTTINMNNNTHNGSTITGVNTGTYYEVYNSSGTLATTTINIIGNTLTGSNYSNATQSTGSFAFIYNTGSGVVENIQTNNISGSNLKITATLYCIYSSSSYLNRNNNSNTISNVTRTNTSGTGATYLIYTTGTSGYTVSGNTLNCNSNTISNINLGGITSGSVYGIAAYGSWTVNVNNNTVSNITGASFSGTCYAMYPYYYYHFLICHDNNISGLSLGTVGTTTGGTIYGTYLYTYYGYTQDFYNNSFSNFTGTMTTIYCLYHAFQGYDYASALTNAPGNYSKVYNNQWYNIGTSSTASSTSVIGYYQTLYTTPSSIQVYNNRWGDLKNTSSLTTTSSPMAVVGFYISGAYTPNIVYNSMYINASSSATNYSTMGLYIATASTVFNFRNNILVNSSTPGSSTGFTSCVRSASGAATGFTANNNMYYYGTPSATRLMYAEGGTTATAATNGKQTLAAYQSYINTSQEGASVVENPPFQATTGGGATFLNFASAAVTQAESGAATYAAVTTDYNATTRGSTGTAPDMGAFEFFGASPAPSVSGVSASPTGPQCTTTSRTITATATAPSGCTIDGTNGSGVFLNYSINGVAQTAITMSNGGSGTTYTGTLPASVPTNATIVWYVSAVDYLNSSPTTTFSKSSSNTSYQDDPYLGLTNSFTVSPNPICLLTSTTLSVTSAGSTTLPTGYPACQASTTSDDEIVGVALGTGSSFTNLFNNPSSCGNTGSSTTLNGLPASIAYEYQNYTNLSTVPTLISGTTYNWQISIGFCTTSAYSTGFAIYIDLNRDGAFSAAERMYTTPATVLGTFPGPNVYTGTFTLPSTGLKNGYTLMRVVDAESVASPASSGTWSWGEVEDYRVNLVAAGFTSNWTSNSNPITSTTALTYTYTPSAAGTESINLAMTDANGCSLNSAGAQTLTINAVPTAPTATPSSQCGTAIPGASVATTNSSGGANQYYWYTASTAGTLLQMPPNSGTLGTYYSNTFALSTLTNAALSGVGAISGGVCALKGTAASTQGGFTVNAAGYNSTLYQIDYDMAVTATGTTIADGTSYSFGDDVNDATSSPTAEHGSGSKLRLGFFTYNTASGADGKGIYLMYGVSALSSYTSSTTGVLGYSTNVAWNPTSATTVNSHVTITINALGQATVSVGGTAIFTNVQLPAGFLSADKSTWKHAFSARSGGVAGGFSIDNLVIQQDPLGTGSTTYLSTISAPTTFYVSEMGTNGCLSPRTSTFASVFYGDAVSITSSAAANTPIANGICLGSTVSLSALQTGSNSNAYTYTWSALPLAGSGLSGTVAGGTSSSPVPLNNVQPTAAGTYTYTVNYTDGNCSGSATKVITVSPLPSVGAPIPSVTGLCAGTSFTAIATAQGSQTLPTGYGLSNATYTVDEEILGVSMSCVGGGTLNNISTCSNTGNATALNGLPASIQNEYSNYTNLTATRLIYGAAVTGTVTRSYCNAGTNYSNIFAVYIDWNRDGSFTGTGETVFTGTYAAMTQPPGTASPFNFTVPTSAATGVTLMRVVLSESTLVTPTGTYSWGETEDYLVDVQGPSALNTYSWNFGSNTGVATGGTPTIAGTATTTVGAQNLTFVATTITTGCQSTSPAAVVTVNPVPSQPTMTNGAHCGASVNVANAASTSGLSSPLFNWYAALTGGTALQSSASTTFTAATSATTTWYVSEATASGCLSSPRLPVTETVTTPDAVTASNTATSSAICLNGSFTLNAAHPGTGNTYVYTWTANPATGSGIPTSSVGQSVNVTPTAAGVYTYTVTAVDATTNAPTTCTVISSTTVTVNILPSGLVAPSVTNSNVCGGETVALCTVCGATAGSGSLPTYPLSNATSTGDDEIVLVQLGTGGSLLNSSSSCGTTGGGAANGLPASAASFYSNYTGTYTAPVLSLNSTVPYSLSVGFCIASVYTTTVGIFIDYNHNGVFTDAGELVGIQNILSTSNSLAGIPVSGSFVVPTTATTGLTVMRVVDIEGSYTSTTLPPYTALTYTWGETEDYLVNILPPYTYTWNIGASTNVASGYSTTATAPTSAGNYNVVAVASNSFGCQATTPATVLTVNALPAAPTASAPSTQCGLALPNVSVSNGTGVHTWAWYTTSTGGTALQTATTNKYTTPISTTTTFYVSQVNNTSGCQSLPRTAAIANVTTPNPIAITNNNGNSNNCWGTALSLTAAKSPNTGVNNYTYSWTASPLTGSGLTGATSGATITPTPTIAGSYVYTVTATDATLGCVTTATANITELPNLTAATVTTQAPTTCGSLGSILVSPPITSSSLTTLYQSNFNSSTINSTYEYVCGTPTPTYNGNYLVLTQTTNSQEGNYQILNPLGVDADIWQTEFDLTTVGAQGADGFSYNFGDNCSPICAVNGGQEVGNGDKLHLSFDAYTNGSNVAGIYLTYGTITNTAGHYPPNTPSAGSNPDVLGYASDITWTGGNTSHVTVTINAGGQVTVTMGSTTLFSNVQLPAAYLTANKSTWTHLFMARTGGVNQGHQLGNVSVKYIPRIYQYSSNFTAGTPTWQNGSSFAVAVGSYNMGIKSLLNGACTASLGTAVVGNSPTLTASASSLTGCPGSLTVLSFTPALTGYTYQWQSSTTSATTGFNPISGATSSTLTWGVPSTSTWYRVAVTCAGNTTFSSAVNIAASTSASTVPYLEDFESIATANTLPTCVSYGSGNANLMILGQDLYTPSYTTYSTLYTSQQNHTPGGSKYMSFYYYNSNGASYANDRYVYTPSIHMVGGQTYQASVWYANDNAGASGNWNINLKYGPAQSPTGMTNIVSKTGILGTTYNVLTQLKGTFTPATTGDYVIAVEVTNAAYSYYALGVDDIEVLPACSGTPSVGTLPSTAVACTGQSTTLNMGASSAYGFTYQWEQSTTGTGAWASVASNGTSSTYNTPTTLPASPTYYRCKVTCSNGGLFAYSNSCAVSNITCQFNIARTTGITYNDISTSPTVQHPTWSVVSPDDGITNAISLPSGFNFTFNGKQVTSVRMCTNGWMTLDGAGVTGGQTVYTANFTSAGQVSPMSVVAPFWCDLQTPGYPTVTGQASLDAGIWYDVQGSAPNRVAIFEWKGIEKYYNPGPDLNFQVKLYESSNQANHKIEIVHGTMLGHNGTVNNYYYASIGIKGANISSTPQVGECYVLQNLNTNRFDKAQPTSSYFYSAPVCNESYMFIPGTGYTMPAAPSTAAPANDNPAGATALALNNGPCTDMCYKFYNTNYATPSGQSVCTGSSTVNADDDVWFSITLPGTPTTGSTGIGVNVWGGYGFAPRFEVWNSTATTLVDCHAAAVGLMSSGLYTYSQLTSGQTYLIRVYHDASGFGSYDGQFGICTYENFPPPANDDPCGAYALTSSTGTACQLTNYSTVSATQSVTTTSPAITIPAPSCAFTNDDDVWFTYTATNPTASIYVQGNGAFDPVVELYTATGTCSPSLTLVSSSAFGASCTNVTGTGGLETINLTNLVTSGTPTKLYIRVYHKLSGFGSGSFGICILSNTPPANDACANATSLVFGTACNPTSATSAYATLSQAVSASCSTTNPDDDVWFTVTRPSTASSMNVVVTGSSNYDPAFEVFTGSVCGSLTSLGCTNTSSSSSNATESKLFTGLLAATTTYRIRVYNVAAGFGSGTFTICVYSGTAPANVIPCASINASANSGHVAGVSNTVVSAYDNGSSVYGGMNNNNVLANPPSGPSMVYYTGSTAYAYAYTGEPTPSCGSVATTPKPVWYRFRVPTFTAGVTLRSVSTYGQSMTPILAAYTLVGTSQLCNNPVFTQIGCSSSGTLTLSSTSLSSYVGQYIYVQLQGTSSVPSGNYTLAVQGVVNGITLTNPTTTTLRVNFPSFSAPAPGKYVVYWRKVGATGANYVNLSPTSNYTIGGLTSNQNYEVWVKFVDITSATGSQIYCAKASLPTTAGCGGNLSAPLVTGATGHCSVVSVTWPSPSAQGVPTLLIPAASTYPYRLVWSFTSAGSFHGFVQAIASLPSTGYGISGLQLSQNYSFYYTFKCVGGALMTSYTTSYATCSGPARLNAHTEYVIGGVHYVDATEEELMNALTANVAEDGEVHEFNLVNIANQEETNQVPVTSVGNFELIPNPTSNTVSVNYSLPAANLESVMVKVMDVQGKVVREEKIQTPNQYGNVKFDLSDVEAGVYLVNIQTEGYTETKKLVVSK